MKKFRLVKTLVILISVFAVTMVFPQKDPSGNQNEIKNQLDSEVKTQLKFHGNQFIDNNGDGYNDNAPDADGDGIPNGRDEDYSGSKFRKGNGSRGFVDLNGDGINDNAIDSDGDGIPNGQDPDYIRPNDGTGQQKRFGNQNQRGGYKWGVINGTGNCGIGSENGNGFGAGKGSGNCDGTGPKGNRRGGRR